MDVTLLTQRLSDRRISVRRLLSGAMGVLLFAQPVAAQSGAEMLRSGVCGTRVAPMVGAVWGAGVLIFAAYGVYRGVTGFSKMGGSDPGEVTEGRERVKGAFYSFGASLLLLILTAKIL